MNCTHTTLRLSLANTRLNRLHFIIRSRKLHVATQTSSDCAATKSQEYMRIHGLCSRVRVQLVQEASLPPQRLLLLDVWRLVHFAISALKIRSE